MHPHLYWNKGPDAGFFEVGTEAGFRTHPPGVGRGAAFADYDADGDADLLIARFGGRARLLRNDSPTGHWVGFKLRAASGHPSGIGTRIVVHANGRAYLQEAGAGPSYLSQNYSDVLFGLAEATRVERLEVSWPGGHREVWSDIAVDRLWHLQEGRPPQPVGDPTALAAGSDRHAPRTSAVSRLALVSDVASNLTRVEKQRFWELNRRAQDLFTAGNWQEAAAAYADMGSLDPRHEDALYYRGNSLLELERYAEASECWQQLLSLNPSSSRALIQLGIVHALPTAGALFDLNAALMAFEAAHSINREESRPLMLRGEVDLAQGRIDAAQESLEAAYRMNPRATTALYLSGYIAWKRGDTRGALELLERARASLEKEVAVRGVPGEGDTRSDDMAAIRRKAAQRRLFADCVEALRAAREPLAPEQSFPCVDRTRAKLVEPKGSNAAAAPPIPVRAPSIT
jgi:tetratricopeptide (TPR) repeat protein